MSKFTNPNAIQGQPVLRGDILLKAAAQLDKLKTPGHIAVTSPDFINGSKKFAIENIPVGSTPGDLIQEQRPFDVGFPSLNVRTLTSGTWSPWRSQAAPSNFAVGGGTAQAQTATLALVVAYVAGMEISYIATVSNTAAAPTVNLNGLGAKTVKLGVGGATSDALVADAIKIGLLVRLQYDGTDFRLLNPQATA